jgi:hypothetical protein
MSNKQRGFIDMGLIAIITGLVVVMAAGLLVWQNARHKAEVDKKRANSATEINPGVKQ